MISVDVVLKVHLLIINKYGGTHGLRDRGNLESALARPFATFDGIDLYPSSIEKASAIFESLIINHLFIDGNKRTAFVMMRILLHLNKYQIISSEDELYNFIISAAKGDLEYSTIREWLGNHTKEIQ
jgi:death-on-curing protein